MMQRKKRRISYRVKAKNQRMKLYTLVAAIVLLFAASMGALADNGIHEVTVTAESGDTLWTLCEPYKPEKMDLRLFIEKVKYENHLQNACLSIGQEIVIPLD